ncbi:hypothetical protein TNCV_3486421 [Trichonephila clavipes]|nr:hypothetical protein TNCV_3486421 [Trichonephila clavipes]
MFISATTSSVDQRAHSTTAATLNLWCNASWDSAFYHTWSKAGTKSIPTFRAGKMPGHRINGSKADTIRHFAGNFRPCKRGPKVPVPLILCILHEFVT